MSSSRPRKDIAMAIAKAVPGKTFLTPTDHTLIMIDHQSQMSFADACGDVSTEAHEMAMQRMIQRGARPMTSLQYLLELQRDWARSETYDETVKTSIANGGAYGLGLIYAKTMFGASEAH
jgi:hypothetical protein